MFVVFNCEIFSYSNKIVNDIMKSVIFLLFRITLVIKLDSIQFRVGFYQVLILIDFKKTKGRFSHCQNLFFYVCSLIILYHVDHFRWFFICWKGCSLGMVPYEFDQVPMIESIRKLSEILILCWNRGTLGEVLYKLDQDLMMGLMTK